LGLSFSVAGFAGHVNSALWRERLAHVIAVNKRQVQYALDDYRRYYNQLRTQLYV
jgi:hypothetical protein